MLRYRTSPPAAWMAIGPRAYFASVASAMSVPFSFTVNFGPRAVISTVVQRSPASYFTSGVATLTIEPVRPA